MHIRNTVRNLRLLAARLSVMEVLVVVKAVDDDRVLTPRSRISRRDAQC